MGLNGLHRRIVLISPGSALIVSPALAPVLDENTHKADQGKEGRRKREGR